MIIANFPININKISKYSIKNIQRIYNRHISNINFSSVICPHCGHCCWKYHACYKRSFYHAGLLYKISISRVRCNHCHKTHSILPDFLVPYAVHSSDTIIEALAHSDVSLLDDALFSYWSNKIDHYHFVSHFLLCILSKRLSHCIYLFSHGFFVFSSDVSYNCNSNNESR